MLINGNKYYCFSYDITICTPTPDIRFPVIQLDYQATLVGEGPQGEGPKFIFTYIFLLHLASYK